MCNKFVSERNLKFLLYEVGQMEQLCQPPFFADHDRESFDMILGTALRMANQLLYPAFRDLDQNPPELVEGQSGCVPWCASSWSNAARTGWLSATFSYEHQDMQLPVMVNTACLFAFASANFSAYLELTTGAATSSSSLAHPSCRRPMSPPYALRPLTGHHGPDRAPGRQFALRRGRNRYAHGGGALPDQRAKIFINAGDHDAMENMMHLMLVRIKGASAEVKDFSLFVVPKLRPEGDGLKPNDLNTAGLFYKLGYLGCPIVQLAMDEAGDCRGWLVGEPNKGLA